MQPLRVYTDTSVLGGCLDPEFRADSLRFMDAVRRGRCVALVSDVVLAELNQAPEEVRTILLSLPPTSIERVSLTTESLALRDAYIAAGILGPRWADDAAHVAIATVARADAIVSWNFRHIVRLDIMKAYNDTNLAMGYGVLTILSPREALLDEPDDD